MQPSQQLWKEFTQKTVSFLVWTHARGFLLRFASWLPIPYKRKKELVAFVGMDSTEGSPKMSSSKGPLHEVTTRATTKKNDSTWKKLLGPNGMLFNPGPSLRLQKAVAWNESRIDSGVSPLSQISTVSHNQTLVTPVKWSTKTLKIFYGGASICGLFVKGLAYLSNSM